MPFFFLTWYVCLSSLPTKFWEYQAKSCFNLIFLSSLTYLIHYIVAEAWTTHNLPLLESIAGNPVWSILLFHNPIDFTKCCPKGS